MREVLFSKYSMERSPQFAIRTSIVRDGERRWVEKSPMTKDAAAHVEKLASSYGALCRAYEGTRVRPCPVVVENGVAKFEFLEGEFFHEKLGRLIEEKDEEGILALCEEYVSIVKSGAGVEKFRKMPEFVRVFGDVELPDGLTAMPFSNVDWIFENLIEKENGDIALIDYEWCFDFPVPLEYVLYRSLYFTFARWDMQAFVDHVLCPKVGITEDLISATWRIEAGFIRHVAEGGRSDTAWHEYMSIIQKGYDWKGEIERTRQEWERQRHELLLQHEEAKRELMRQHEEAERELMRWHEETEQELIRQREKVRQDLIQQCEIVRQSLTQQCEALGQQLTQAQYDYSIISNAFFWKVTKPFRVIVDALKRVKLFRVVLDTLKRMKLPRPESVDEKGNVKKYLGPIPRGAIKQVYKHTIDVIVPVFNGFSYLERLLASIEQTEVPYQLVLVEDKSTDPRVLPFLKAYVGQRSNVVLMENEANLGFVRSVNQGLSYSKNHVAIVNTDVVLPQGWLERLMLPIIEGENVASSTPFTNSGTICSFPNFCQDNELFLNLDVQQIDSEFAKITPRYPIIPTGVGFCMGMNRETLDTIGLLDAETFGKGYGEENDWCRRAEEAGFVNVHTENLFVYHQHGASFPSEEKQALLKKNGEALLKKHPDYNRVVAQYCQEDPCAPVREHVKEQLMRRDEQIYTVLAFNHSWGGGASAYLLRECQQLLRDGKRIVQVEYQPEKRVYQIKYLHETEALEKNVSAKTFAGLCKTLPERVDEIWVNELVTYPKLYQVLEEIPVLAKNHGARLLYLLHDYFALCPTINLLDTKGEYCKLPDCQSCENCLKSNPHFRDIHRAEKKDGMMAWRKHWLEFLKRCDEIRTFSNASRELLVRVFTELPEENITVCPHQIDYLPRIDSKKKRTKTLNIGMIGVIAENKGIQLVKQIAKLIKRDGTDIRLVIIGEACPPISPELCCTTGAYQRSMLPSRALENDIDIVLIPSIWPETFSYTTEEAMTMGLPVACFDIGAPVERVARYEKGLVLPQLDAESALQQLQKYTEESLLPRPDKQRSVLFVAERKDYASRYRVEHFQEELLFHGVGSDFVLVHEIRRVDISQYDAVVSYRCSSVREGTYLRKETERIGIKLFFDIDDLVFDSEAVSNSCMPEEEKKAYLSKAEGYCINMGRADGLIASTEVLAERMKQLFPDKPVCIRRNSASLEMETLSVCAGHDFQESKDNIVSLAYFSGSWTHDGDFAQITTPLLHIFQKHPNVKLKVYGCLNIPSQLEDYRNRIEQYEFTTDWRSLPEKCAQADIHLAPLENTLFNACKSENKWMEAALAGRVTVMSKLPELERVVKNGETGFLCVTPEEWENTLSLLIESAERRREVAKNAQADVLGTHLTRNSGKETVAFVLMGRE